MPKGVLDTDNTMENAFDTSIEWRRAIDRHGRGIKTRKYRSREFNRDRWRIDFGNDDRKTI